MRMGREIKLEYFPGDFVKIIPLNCDGQVIHANIGMGLFIEYKVRYWLDAERKEEWLLAEEMEARNA